MDIILQIGQAPLLHVKAVSVVQATSSKVGCSKNCQSGWLLRHPSFPLLSTLVAAVTMEAISQMGT